MITINLTPEQYSTLLDGLTISDKVMQWGDYKEENKRFKKLLDEIDLAYDSLNQENVCELKE